MDRWICFSHVSNSRQFPFQSSSGKCDSHMQTCCKNDIEEEMKRMCRDNRRFLHQQHSFCTCFCLLLQPNRHTRIATQLQQIFSLSLFFLFAFCTIKIFKVRTLQGQQWLIEPTREISLVKQPFLSLASWRLVPQQSIYYPVFLTSIVQQH